MRRILALSISLALSCSGTAEALRSTGLEESPGIKRQLLKALGASAGMEENLSQDEIRMLLNPLVGTERKVMLLAGDSSRVYLIIGEVDGIGDWGDKHLAIYLSKMKDPNPTIVARFLQNAAQELNVPYAELHKKTIILSTWNPQALLVGSQTAQVFLIRKAYSPTMSWIRNTLNRAVGWVPAFVSPPVSSTAPEIGLGNHFSFQQGDRNISVLHGVHGDLGLVDVFIRNDLPPITEAPKKALLFWEGASTVGFREVDVPREIASAYGIPFIDPIVDPFSRAVVDRYILRYQDDVVRLYGSVENATRHLYEVLALQLHDGGKPFRDILIDLPIISKGAVTAEQLNDFFNTRRLDVGFEMLRIEGWGYLRGLTAISNKLSIQLIAWHLRQHPKKKDVYFYVGSLHLPIFEVSEIAGDLRLSDDQIEEIIEDHKRTNLLRYLAHLSGAGLEQSQVTVPTVDQLTTLNDKNAWRLAQEAKAAGVSNVLLIPQDLIDITEDFDRLTITLFAQESVVAKALSILTPEKKAPSLIVYPLYIPSDPNGIGKFAREQIKDVPTPVLALDLVFESVATEILPNDHPLTLLFEAEDHFLMPYRKALATLLSHPPKEGTHNLILKLTRGSIRRVTIGGRDYTAIFA